MNLNRANRDGRITNKNTRKHVRKMLAAMVERLGYQKTAKYIDWNSNPLHAVVADDDWRQRIVYPEDVSRIELVHDVIMNYANLSDYARDLSLQLIDQANTFASTARQLRRVLRKM